MNRFYSFTAFAVILLLLSYCDRQQESCLPPSLVVKTIDGFGKPVAAKIVYQSLDCEYDFTQPQRAFSNKYGVTTIYGLPAGPVQLYAEGYLYESYQCYQYAGGSDTLIIYGSKIPTYIQTVNACGTKIAGVAINSFVNTSGNCEYEQRKGTITNTNIHGFAAIYLPQGNTYKVQIDHKGNRLTQCYQPSQQVDTLKFTVKCKKASGF